MVMVIIIWARSRQELNRRVCSHESAVIASTRGGERNATLLCLAVPLAKCLAVWVLGTAWGWSNLATVLLSTALAFVFGYVLSLRSVLRSGVPPKQAVRLVLLTDTVSIATMEVVDNPSDGSCARVLWTLILVTQYFGVHWRCHS